MQDFVLCPENFHGIPFQKYENDFTFIVNGKTYKTNRFVADILSPKIKQAHFTDPTNNEFYINFKENPESSNREDYFQELLTLANYQKTKIDLDRQKHFIEYFYLLCNITEYVHLIEDQSKEIQVDNVIDRLISILSIEHKMDEFISIDVHSSKEIFNFIACHFEEIDKEQLSKLDIEMLDEIFKSDSLQINDEDSLLQFFISLYHKDASYSFLFEYILFSNISQKSIEKFIETVQFDHINSAIWNSTCERLLHPNDKQLRKKLETKCNQNTKIDFIEIHHCKNKEFHGIMNYLYEKTGSNIHENGTINITSNSICNENYHPKIVLIIKLMLFIALKIEVILMFCFDFKDFLIHLDCYSIKSPPKSWVYNDNCLRN